MKFSIFTILIYGFLLIFNCCLLIFNWVTPRLLDGAVKQNTRNLKVTILLQRAILLTVKLIRKKRTPIKVESALREGKIYGTIRWKPNTSL